MINFLKNLREDEWELMITDKWNVKDVLAHLVGWLEEVIKVLPVAWATKKMPWFIDSDDYEDFNDRIIRKYKNLSPNELIKRYNALDEKLDNLVNELGEEKMRADKRFDWVFDDGHELMHLKRIKDSMGRHFKR